MPNPDCRSQGDGAIVHRRQCGAVAIRQNELFNPSAATPLLWQLGHVDGHGSALQHFHCLACVHGVLLKSLSENASGSTTSPTLPPMFENAELLTKIFGGWPSFCNAEVLSVSLSRRGALGPTVDIGVNLVELKQDLVAPGCWYSQNPTDAVLRFTGVELHRLAGMNRRNEIDDLLVSEIDPAAHDGRRWLIEIVPRTGLSARFECVGGRVLSVQPHLIDAE